jgi:hypothetical protein
LARRLEAVEVWKCRESIGDMKDLKMNSAPLFPSAVHRVVSDRGEGALPEHGKRQPQEKHKLEGVVEGEPVDNADDGFDNASQARLADSTQEKKGQASEGGALT